MTTALARPVASVVLCLTVAAGSQAQELAPEEPGTPLAPTPPTLEVKPPTVPAKEATTKFGLISVVGSEQQVRGGIASLAQSLFTELNSLCNEKGRKMKIPLIIRLYGARGDVEQQRSIVSDIAQIQDQYQLNIHIHLARGVDQERLRYHLMEMLLYERGLGNAQAVAAGERVLVKPWLIVGLLETIEHRAGRGNRKLYQAKIPYLEIMPIQQMFDATEKQWLALDGRKPLAFRALSGAMVSSLVRQPKGRPSMAAYLADFATFKGESENLMRKHFPAMNQSRNSLEKWVSLEMLELGTARNTEAFSILETEKRLDSILKLRYRDKEGLAKTVDIEGYQEIIEVEDASKRLESVAGARSELERLSYRCFPTYRPLLDEYGMILRDIVRGKDKQIPARLKKLAEVRLNSQKAAKRVRDYLDWYYITQSNHVGGSFLQYRELSDALQQEALRPPRNDATEGYLDRIQRIYGGGSER